MSLRITSTAEWFRCIGPAATREERHAAVAKLVRLLVAIDRSHRFHLQVDQGRQPHASARQAPTTFSGEQSLTPTSAGFGNRVLVGDPLHNSARNGSTIDRFCKTAVIDRLRKRPLMAALFFG